MNWLYKLLILINFPAHALAGWTSGGGELFTDEYNPWFVENTKKVEYCIEIDEEHFGQTADVARQKIKSALDFWKREFAETEKSVSSDVPFDIATQVFEEATCGEKTDITFQFGTLNDQQKKFLKYPKRVIGAAVRTHYDAVNLKAKGFVYISPETGSLGLENIDSW